MNRPDLTGMNFAFSGISLLQEAPMASIKNELVLMMGKALELKQSAQIQYLTIAQEVAESNLGPIIARLREIAIEEVELEQKFQTMIADSENR
jgi:hypothetical protein